MVYQTPYNSLQAPLSSIAKPKKQRNTPDWLWLQRNSTRMAKDSHSLLLPHLRSPTSESFHLQLQEWIVEQYRRKCAADKSRTDGYSTSDLVRQFRHKFKIDIQF